MSSQNRVAILVSGGLVQAVWADEPIEVIVIDEDNLEDEANDLEDPRSDPEIARLCQPDHATY